MTFLSPNQQRQSTEGESNDSYKTEIHELTYQLTCYSKLLNRKNRNFLWKYYTKYVQENYIHIIIIIIITCVNI